MKTIHIGPDYSNEHIPEDLKCLIEHWKEDSKQGNTAFQAEWEEKNAGLIFTWKGQEYRINDRTLEITPEYFSCYSAHVMEKELHEMGISSIYTGDLW